MGTPRSELSLFEPGVFPTDIRVSPKRPREETAGLADLFPYYAGFSYDWARTRLAATDDAAVVLDPWNGSGTTTLAAASLGIKSIGVDLNPIANVVARLRARSGRYLTIQRMPQPASAVIATTPQEPLCAWFSDQTAARLRQWQTSLSACTRDTRDLGLLAIFRVVRQLTRSFEGSNPTWVRRAQREEDRLDLDAPTLDEAIRTQESAVARRLQSADYLRGTPVITTASSRVLPIRQASIDAIVTSPPYLTRIDYAVAYARELAVLGLDVRRDRKLRASLMGTTLIRSATHAEGTYGPLATRLLEEISAHPSKDSSGYYMKQARQYIEDLVISIREMARVASHNAVSHIVVQDSYYKNILIPLASLVIEEAERVHWRLQDIDAFPVSRILTTINSSARSYQKGTVSESVITLRRMRND